MSKVEVILIHLLKIFGNQEVCLEWLKAPQGFLGGKSPLLAIASGEESTVLWLAELQAGAIS